MMVKFKFFVHCKGWAGGGYYNTQFAESAQEAKKIIAEWNTDESHPVDLIAIEEISNAEFAEDFVGSY